MGTKTVDHYSSCIIDTTDFYRSPMASRCTSCNRFAGRGDTVACTGNCGKSFHINCAKKNLSYDPLECDVYFRCDACIMHRSTMTPRTPDASTDQSISLDRLSDRRVTLEDLMSQVQNSSIATDNKLIAIKNQQTISLS